jgi:rhodanese-related sulfurtransferase
MCACESPAPRNVDDLLAQARSGLRRLDPAVAFRAARSGAITVDTRPEWQRRADGEIPGAIVIERNHLEWRCDPGSPARVPEATGYDVTWIVCCDEGFSSSIAAASLQTLGLSKATDVTGGFRAWRAAGLLVVKPAEPVSPRLAPAATASGQGKASTNSPTSSINLGSKQGHHDLRSGPAGRAARPVRHRPYPAITQPISHANRLPRQRVRQNHNTTEGRSP